MRPMELSAALPNDLARAQALIAKLTAEAADRDRHAARIEAENIAFVRAAAGRSWLQLLHP